jgi:hypothetical protein
MIRIIRFMLVPALVGVLSVSVAWAGAGLAPVPTVSPDDLVAAAAGTAAAGTATAGDGFVVPARSDANPGGRVPDGVNPPPLSGAQDPGGGGEGDPIDREDWDGLWAGAAKVSIHPEQEWETEGCETLGDDAGPEILGHTFELSSPWPRNPDCIYVGGYGIGPMNSVIDFDDEYGLWARSVALSDGDETVVLTVIDGVYWFAEYSTMCDGCGALALGEELGEELGIDPAGFVFAATHSHTAPDFIGGWGGVPEWYMEQAAEAMRRSVRDAFHGMAPAIVEGGEVLAREHNRERRNTYRSAEEAGLSWFRATSAEDGDTIATVGAYAAHPTSVGSNDRVAHPDWPGAFIQRVEERFGGIGLHFMTGLGNMSTAGGMRVGPALANLIPEVGEGTPVTTPEVRVSQARWKHPVTNPALTALAVPGFFDRPFSGPASVREGKSAERPCVSASPVSVDTVVSAARVGELWITGAPGEIFSNYSNTIKERTAGNGTIATFPLGMSNDAMGYINQSFEHFDESRLAAVGFTGVGAFEYEDSYSIDRCFGDMALETTLGLIDTLR